MSLNKVRESLFKATYFWRNGLQRMLPLSLSRRRLDYWLAVARDDGMLVDRANYYNKKNDEFCLKNPERVGDFLHAPIGKGSSYHMDLFSLLRYFPESCQFVRLFGDITAIPEQPTLLKSRPIAGPNENSVIIKLNSVRHYYFEKDDIPFENKIPKVIWRGKAHVPWRKELVETYYEGAFCDIGAVPGKDRIGVPEKDFLSVRQQLAYRYILSVEGYDVATNLKWIFASNSLCMMRRPRYETWFREGTLIPGYHYVLLNDDHSDMEEKVDYYERHPDEAKEITRNASLFFRDFLDPRRETLTGLLVLDKYFSRQAGQ